MWSAACSEDGKVFFWDLVEVSLPTPTPHWGACPVTYLESLSGLKEGEGSVLLELGARGNERE